MPWWGWLLIVLGVFAGGFVGAAVVLFYVGKGMRG